MSDDARQSMPPLSTTPPEPTAPGPPVSPAGPAPAGPAGPASAGLAPAGLSSAGAWPGVVPTSSGAVPASRVRRQARAGWLIAGYLVVFFGAMALGGILFLLGGLTIIVIPGSVPRWVAIGYVLLGVVGSVAIAIVAANTAFRVAARSDRSDPSRSRSAGESRNSPPPGQTGDEVSRPRLLSWAAGIIGTVIAAALSTIATAVITNWLNR
jgi:hypothetical protein